jgi:hypothetical protein
VALENFASRGDVAAGDDAPGRAGGQRRKERSLGAPVSL